MHVFYQIFLHSPLTINIFYQKSVYVCMYVYISKYKYKYVFYQIILHTAPYHYTYVHIYIYLHIRMYTCIYGVFFYLLWCILLCIYGVFLYSSMYIWCGKQKQNRRIHHVESKNIWCILLCIYGVFFSFAFHMVYSFINVLLSTCVATRLYVKCIYTYKYFCLYTYISTWTFAVQHGRHSATTM